MVMVEQLELINRDLWRDNLKMEKDMGKLIGSAVKVNIYIKNLKMVFMLEM